MMSTATWEFFFGALIFLNSGWIGLDLSLGIDARPAPLPSEWGLITHVFAALFLFELVVRLIGDGVVTFFTSEDMKWNCFDFFLVASSFVEVALDIVKAVAGGDESGGPGILSNMRLIRIIRATRLIRLLRIARIVRFVRALSILIFSILNCLKSLVWALVLMVLMIYFFAILFCQAASTFIAEACPAGDGYATCAVWDEDIVSLDKYWGTLSRAMLTLFMVMSNGLDWETVIEPLGQVGGHWAFMFLVFVAFATFAVLNVVTGVFCQSALESAQRDRELMVQSLLMNKRVYVESINSQFKAMFDMFNNEGEGLTLDVFEQHLQEQTVREYFALLELDTSDAFGLFKLLDEDGSGQIDAEEFVDGCLRLKGSARSIDLAKMGREIRSLANVIAMIHDEQRRMNGELVTSSPSHARSGSASPF
jgi:hypothetical protein